MIEESADSVEHQVLSNEPGYYEPGKYGIRIENVVVVKEVDTLKKGGYLGFERVTMVRLFPPLLPHYRVETLFILEQASLLIA
jgi:hypothetical protein